MLVQLLPYHGVEHDLHAIVAKQVLGEVQHLQIFVEDQGVCQQLSTVCVELVLSQVQDSQYGALLHHVGQHACILQAKHVVWQTQHYYALQLGCFYCASHEIVPHVH